MEQHYSKLHERDQSEKVIAQKGIIADIERKIANCEKLANGAIDDSLRIHYMKVCGEYINELKNIKNMFKGVVG